MENNKVLAFKCKCGNFTAISEVFFDNETKAFINKKKKQGCKAYFLERNLIKLDFCKCRKIEKSNLNQLF